MDLGVEDKAVFGDWWEWEKEEEKAKVEIAVAVVAIDLRNAILLELICVCLYMNSEDAFLGVGVFLSLFFFLSCLQVSSR